MIKISKRGAFFMSEIKLTGQQIYDAVRDIKPIKAADKLCRYSAPGAVCLRRMRGA